MIIIANCLDTIYFIDPHPLSAEIIRHDHDVFGAERRCLSMDDVLSGDLIYVFAFLLAGLVFAGGPFVVVHLLAARKTRNYAGKTDQFIECGMEPISDIRQRFSVKFYLVAMLFILFDVEAGGAAGARPRQLALAADVWPRLLRHRNDGGGRLAL